MKIQSCITGCGCISYMAKNKNDYCEYVNSQYNSGHNCSETLDQAIIFNSIKDFSFYDNELLKEQYKLDISCQYILEASRQAILDAGLENELTKYSTKVGVIVGSTLGLLNTQNKFLTGLYKNSTPSSILFKQSANNLLSGIIAYKYKIRGFNTTVFNGWTSSIDDIILAQSLVSNGILDIVIVGCVDIVSEIMYAYIEGMLKKESVPHVNSNLNKFVFSESAGVIIIENRNFAESRGAYIQGYLNNGSLQSKYINMYDLFESIKIEQETERYFASINGMYSDHAEKIFIRKNCLEEQTIPIKLLCGEFGSVSGIMQIIFAIHLKIGKSLIANVSPEGKLSLLYVYTNQ